MRCRGPIFAALCVAGCVISCGSTPPNPFNSQQSSNVALTDGCETILQPGDRCQVEANCCATPLICLDNICMAKPAGKPALCPGCDSDLPLGEVCDAAEVECCAEGLKCADNICVPQEDATGCAAELPLGSACTASNDCCQGNLVCEAAMVAHGKVDPARLVALVEHVAGEIKRYPNLNAAALLCRVRGWSYDPEDA